MISDAAATPAEELPVLEPTWSPACNNAYKFVNGVKEWACDFKSSAGPNLMRVAVWADGSEWEIPGVVFHESAEASAVPSNHKANMTSEKPARGKVERIKRKHPEAVSAIAAVRGNKKAVQQSEPKKAVQQSEPKKAVQQSEPTKLRPLHLC